MCTVSTPSLFFQVNGENVRSATHEEAAAVLKGAGTNVTLVVEHCFSEFQEFQARLQQFQDEQQAETTQQPVTSQDNKPAPARQLYVR